jgi:hypothetical protein
VGIHLAAGKLVDKMQLRCALLLDKVIHPVGTMYFMFHSQNQPLE